LNLSNHFLIAMPSVLDPIFGGTVVYLCEHNAQGALGLIINKATDMSMESLLDRVDLAMLDSVKDDLKSEVVMFGGPVKMERGFVLHAPHGDYSSMLKVTDQIALTTSRDVLEAVAKGKGPERVMVTLGYAGWSAGQLEQEIASNGWLTVPADPHIVFDLPIGGKFAAAMKLLGIDPMRLTAQAGHA
jgi:putative transcriptional regulator